jgi:hypothetical protein
MENYEYKVQRDSEMKVLAQKKFSNAQTATNNLTKFGQKRFKQDTQFSFTYATKPKTVHHN